MGMDVAGEMQGQPCGLKVPFEGSSPWAEGSRAKRQITDAGQGVVPVS